MAGLVPAGHDACHFGGVDTATVLIGAGDGTFRGAGTVTTGFIPNGVALGDVDGDGRLDLAAAVFGAGSLVLARGISVPR